MMDTLNQLRLHWWDFPPYMNSSAVPPATRPATAWDAEFGGVFHTVLHQVLRRCNVTDDKNLPQNGARILSNKLLNPRGYEALTFGNTPDTMHLLCPFTTDLDGVSILDMPELDQPGLSSLFLPIVDSPGSVHFYLRGEDPAGSDLMTVIQQGWPMLVLILLGAGYSGIIIWLLDRLWNPTNFPKPFIRGFWEGFWWAFVTMTTVGYGDTTPRSFQARIYGLFWILVGITILSVFTATVTTVLTQESLGVTHSLNGILMSVVDGTEDFRLIIKHGGTAHTLETFDLLIATAEASGLKGALFDQYSLASQQDKLGTLFLIESLVSSPVLHGVLMVGGPPDLRQCLQKEVHLQKGRAYRDLARSIAPLTVQTTSAAEKAQNLFQDKTIIYMWYALGIWMVVFVAFVIWEFVYWRPKHKKRQELKARLALEGGAGQLDTQSTTTVDSENANSCFPKRRRQRRLRRKSVVANEAIQSRGYDDHHTYIDRVSDVLKVIDGSSAGLPTKMTGRRATKIYNIESDAYSKNTNAFVGEFLDVSCLETLIRRQKYETEALEDELASYKNQWEMRLRDVKRKHREERRKLLRLMNHDDNIRNDTKPRSDSEDAVTESSGHVGGKTPTIKPNNLSPERLRDDQGERGNGERCIGYDLLEVCWSRDNVMLGWHGSSLRSAYCGVVTY